MMSLDESNAFYQKKNKKNEALPQKIATYGVLTDFDSINSANICAFN